MFCLDRDNKPVVHGSAELRTQVEQKVGVLMLEEVQCGRCTPGLISQNLAGIRWGEAPLSVSTCCITTIRTETPKSSPITTVSFSCNPLRAEDSSSGSVMGERSSPHIHFALLAQITRRAQLELDLTNYALTFLYLKESAGKVIVQVQGGLGRR